MFLTRQPSLHMLQGAPMSYMMYSQITRLNLTLLISFKYVPLLLELLLYFGYHIYIYAIVSDTYAVLIIYAYLLNICQIRMLFS